MASKCGFAVQNAPLDELYKKYADKGLVVLGMPSNDFYQEPSADGAQCAVSYGVSFPVMQMCHVNGTDTHPLYQFLKAEKKSFFMERIKWNYEKFLIDREGQLTLDSHFITDLGLDSLDQVEITIAVEEEFNIELSDRDADDILTPRAAAEKVYANKAAM
ncbi:hypothetical protein HDU83_006915 [Entophlyctis luteolus]|nr:hypothetical protein HDU83_006915 [Entophlyctis luteolus]